MQKFSSKYVVLLYWDKISWYALAALTASLKYHNISYEVIKGELLDKIQNKLKEEYYVDSKIFPVESGQCLAVQNAVCWPWDVIQ